jgi:hypothetical protein
MNERRFPAAPIGLAALLLLLPCLYVGSYLALVRRALPTIVNTDNEPEYCDKYAIGGDVARKAYAPLNALDRRLRPAYWAAFKRFPIEIGPS